MNKKKQLKFSISYVYNKYKNISTLVSLSLQRLFAAKNWTSLKVLEKEGQIYWRVTEKNVCC